MKTLTERQARLRLRAAVEAAGSQKAVADKLPLTPKAAQTAVSRALLGERPMPPAVLLHLGLRRNPRTGEIQEFAPRSNITFVAVQASGEAGVAAAAALISTVLGRDS